MSQEEEPAMTTGRREDDSYCPMHEANTMAIGKHTGQWAILLWILGIGIGLMASIAGGAYYTQQQSINLITASIHSIDNTVTAYTSGHIAESKEGFRRITSLESRYLNHEQRIQALEHENVRANQ